MQPAGQRGPNLRDVFERRPEQLGLREVLGEVRGRHPAERHPDPDPHAHPHPDAHPDLLQARVERDDRVHGRSRGVVRRPQLEGQVVDPERDARRLDLGSLAGRRRLLSPPGGRGGARCSPTRTPPRPPCVPESLGHAA
ncbi:hypothetical protein SGPA1_40480 [Streptomyces misionensis JCM 4497]